MEIINYILSGIIVVISPLIFVKIVLNSKIRKDKSKVIVAILIAIVSYILAYKYTSGIYKTIISFAIYVMLIYNFYKIRFNKSIVLVILFIIILMIPELGIILALKIFNLSKYYFYEIFAGSLISNLVIFSLTIPITIILKKPLTKILNIKITFNNKVAIFSILTLIIVLVFFYDVIANFRIGAKIIFYIIAIIVFVTALVIVLIQENKNTKLKAEYNKLLEFMETYEIELENQRILKHEYKNQLVTIKSKLIDNDKKNKVIEYIDSILGDETKFSQEAYTKLQYLPANGIKALFYFKISEAKTKGINTNVNISSSIKNSKLKDLTTKEFKDLGILIGVYLDNAIEASMNSNNKILGIEMYNNNNEVKIIISNSYNGIIEENKVGKSRYSTKGKGRGYGLVLVNRTLRNTKSFYIEREITSKLYIQTIYIKK